MCHWNSGRGDRDQCRKQYLNKQWLKNFEMQQDRQI